MKHTIQTFLMINRYFIIVSIFYITIGSCSTKSQSRIYNNNYRVLLTNDSMMQINNGIVLNDIIKSVCEKGCINNGSYTGDFTLKYDLKRRSFLSSMKDSLVINIPFKGYICPNAVFDMFNSKLTLSLLDNKDSISDRVKNHIIEARREFDYAPLIEIKLDGNEKINASSKVIFEILKAYIELYEEISLARFNKQIIHLSEDEIKILKSLEPINIRLVPIDNNIYCSEANK